MSRRNINTHIAILIIFVLTLITGCSPSYNLNTEVNPPSSGIITPSTGNYKRNGVISITAKAESGMAFDHWSGDASGTTSVIDVTMNSNKNVIAIFKPLYSFEVSINPPDAGSVSSCNSTYKEGSTVNLVATANEGFIFNAWSGDTKGSTPTIDIVVDTNKHVTANFKPSQTLKIDVSPAGSGTVTPLATQYKIGEKITLTANPSKGHGFVSWEGDVSSSNSSVDIIMDSDKHIAAIFKDNVPPADVLKLTANAGQGKVSLLWQEPPDSDFAKIEVSYDGLSTPLMFSKGTTAADITGLAGQRKYSFIVRTIDTSGNKSNGARIDATPQGISSLDYFKITDGYGINYQVKDSHDGLNCHIWAVSQFNKTRQDRDFNFVFTLTKDETSGGYFGNSLMAGFISRTDGDTQCTTWQFGNPVSNQANFYFMPNLPRFFNDGVRWTPLSGQELLQIKV